MPKKGGKHVRVLDLKEHRLREKRQLLKRSLEWKDRINFVCYGNSLRDKFLEKDAFVFQSEEIWKGVLNLIEKSIRVCNF